MALVSAGSWPFAALCAASSSRAHVRSEGSGWGAAGLVALESPDQADPYQVGSTSSEQINLNYDLVVGSREVYFETCTEGLASWDIA